MLPPRPPGTDPSVPASQPSDKGLTIDLKPILQAIHEEAPLKQVIDYNQQSFPPVAEADLQ